MIEDCLKRLVLRLCFCFLRLRLTVCGPSLLSLFLICVWQIVAPVFLICAWKIYFWPRQYDFLSNTTNFDFQSKRNRRKYSKINHLQSLCWLSVRDPSYPEHLVNSVSNTDTTLCARLSKSRLLSPPQYLLIYIFSLPIFIFSLFTPGLLYCLHGQ